MIAFTIEDMSPALSQVKLQLHDAMYRLRFYSNSLTHILSLSDSHNDVASIQKNRGDKSYRVIVALYCQSESKGYGKTIANSFATHCTHECFIQKLWL